MRAVIPAAFGTRTRLHCPDCNADCDARFERRESCSDYSGNNHETLGGHAGIATAMVFANEFQGTGFPTSGQMI